MKIWILITLTILVSADISNLSQERQQLQELKQKEILLNAKKERNSWIKPLNLSATLNDSSSQTDVYNQELSIGFNQDIFRSGGIGYLMDYASINRRFKLLNLAIEDANLNWELIRTLLEIKKEQNLLYQSDLRVKNQDINIAIKREKYEAGELDATYLDSAIMAKNSQLNQHLLYQKSIQTKMVDLRRLSDKRVEQIELPNLHILTKEEFLKDNLKLNSTMLSAKLKHQAYQITQSSYLPKISLNGKVGTQNYNSSDNKRDHTGEFHTLGVTLSIPLDYNTHTNLQSSKIAYLKAKAQQIDDQKSELAKYDRFKINYQFFEDKIKLSQENIKLFDKLISLTKSEIKAGYKTEFDLKTLQNSKQIELYEMSINQINQELEVMRVLALVLDRR
jgi:outer membrane protein TolC